MAQETARNFGLEPVNHNFFMNNIAQLVECVHVVLDSITIIEDLLASEREKARLPVTPKKGSGVGAVEMPRGILYHFYEFEKNGRIVKADCVIPTSQNNANIHYDLRELADQLAATGKKDHEIEKLASMLVRAYDPCISCSVH